MYLPDMDFVVNKVDLPCQPRKSTLPRKCKKLRQPIKILEAAFDNFYFFEYAVAGSGLGWHGEHFSLTTKSMSGKYIDKSPFSVLKRKNKILPWHGRSRLLKKNRHFYSSLM